MKCFLFPFFLFLSLPLFSQNSKATTNTFSDIDTTDILNSLTDAQRKTRIKLITGVHLAAYAGTLAVLSQAWYDDVSKTRFHTFNDSREWLQVDKVGHAWTAYNIASQSKNMWRWSGVEEQTSVWLGGISSVGYLTILETLDAHSKKWGWSWSDMGANVFGTALYVSQQTVWKEQRIQFKFSTFPVNYPTDLKQRAESLYGASFAEKILKDYNGQTYWLSFNLGLFAKNKNLPAWLNVAVGYGAKGLYGGFNNIGYNKEGNVIFNRTDIKRQRQWYLSPDIDFTKIKTGKRGVKALFSLLNMVKIPAPALELSGGKLRGHLLYF